MKEGGGVLPISFFWLLRNQLSQLVSFLAGEDGRRAADCLKRAESVHFWYILYDTSFDSLDMWPLGT